MLEGTECGLEGGGGALFVSGLTMDSVVVVVADRFAAFAQGLANGDGACRMRILGRDGQLSAPFDRPRQTQESDQLQHTQEGENEPRRRRKRGTDVGSGASDDGGMRAGGRRRLQKPRGWDERVRHSEGELSDIDALYAEPTGGLSQETEDVDSEARRWATRRDSGSLASSSISDGGGAQKRRRRARQRRAGGAGSARRCGRCGRTGHDARTCKGPAVSVCWLLLAKLCWWLCYAVHQVGCPHMDGWWCD